MRRKLQNLRARAVEWIFAHPLPMLAIAVVLFYFAITFGGGILTGITYALQNRTVNKLEQKADRSDENTKTLVNQADVDKLDRLTEDRNRQNLKPQLENASRSVDAARKRTQAARRDYEKLRDNTHDDSNSDSRYLHDRNCSDLRQLYPGEDLQFCQR